MKDNEFDIVMICDWLPPDFGAVGQYAFLAARERAIAGERVALIGITTSTSSIASESFKSGGLLKTRKVQAKAYDRAKMLVRATWTIRANTNLIMGALPFMLRSKSVMFTGSPPFLIHLLVPLNLILRKILIYRITDFHPECLMAQYKKPPLALRLLYRLTVYWRHRVKKFEVLGEDQRARLEQIGIDPDRISLRRDPSPVRIDVQTRPLSRPPSLDGYRILLYSGNLGVAHDYRTFLEAYETHHKQGSGRVAIWLNAVGIGAEKLEKSLRDKGLPYARTRTVPIEDLPALLLAPDAHLITLKTEYSGYVLPSKIYGCLLSKKAVLFIGPSSSDVHLLCKENAELDAYFHCECGEAHAVEDALNSIGSGFNSRTCMGGRMQEFTEN